MTAPATSPYWPTVELYWDRARPHIEAALEHAGGTHTVEDVLEGILAGKLHLWVGARCAAVSECMSFPRRRMLNMFLAGGDLEELKTLAPGIEAFARAHGCSGVMATARMTSGAKQRLGRIVGWLLSWPDYDPGHILCTKELS